MIKVKWMVTCLCLLWVTFVQADMKPIPIYMEDQLGITVTQDQSRFQIKLKSSAGTGFSWFLRSIDNTMIVPEKRVMMPSTTKLTGAVGYELWTFRVKPGAFIVPQQTLIRFIYSRPWDINEQGKMVVARVSTVM